MVLDLVDNLVFLNECYLIYIFFIYKFEICMIFLGIGL